MSTISFRNSSKVIEYTVLDKNPSGVLTRNGFINLVDVGDITSPNLTVLVENDRLGVGNVIFCCRDMHTNTFYHIGDTVPLTNNIMCYESLTNNMLFNEDITSQLTLNKVYLQDSTFGSSITTYDADDSKYVFYGLKSRVSGELNTSRVKGAGDYDWALFSNNVWAYGGLARYVAIPQRGYINQTWLKSVATIPESTRGFKTVVNKFISTGYLYTENGQPIERVQGSTAQQVLVPNESYRISFDIEEGFKLSINETSITGGTINNADRNYVYFTTDSKTAGVVSLTVNAIPDTKYFTKVPFGHYVWKNDLTVLYGGNFDGYFRFKSGNQDCERIIVTSTAGVTTLKYVDNNNGEISVATIRQNGEGKIITTIDSKYKELVTVYYDDNETYMSNTLYQAIYITSALRYNEAPTIFLYKCTAEQNRVNKADWLTYVGAINGTFKEQTSILNMTLKIEYPIPDFNYVYIDFFKRHYFVTDIKSVGYGIWEISLSVDVLMTYNKALRTLKGYVERNEYDYNNLIIDNQFAIEQGKSVDVDYVQNNVFQDDLQFILQGMVKINDN